MSNRSNRFARIVPFVLVAVALAFATHAMKAAPAQSATVDIPKTPAGEQFSAWLAAFNSGERAQLETFRSRFAKPEEHKIEGAFAFRQQVGGFDLKKVDESSPTKLSVLVQERNSDQFARITIEV